MRSHDLFCTHLNKVHPDLATYCFDELGSTNQFLVELAKRSLLPAFCITRLQTDGYGQRKRSWLSCNHSLTFSLLLPVGCPPSELDGITQLIALKLVESLSDYTDHRFQIKWPNDLFTNDKKCGGILVELPHYTKDESWLVVGVGLNISGPDLKLKLSSSGVEASTISFNGEGNACPENFVVRFVSNLKEAFRQFQPGRFHDYLMNYELVDYFTKGMDVIVYDNAHTYKAQYRGLNANGELQLLIDDKLRAYRSGSVSIRPLDI